MINIGIEIDLTMEAHDPSAPAEHDGPNTPRKKIKLEAPSADIPMSETVDNVNSMYYIGYLGSYS